jgi:hypothetical protein
MQSRLNIIVSGMIAADPVRRFPSAEAAELLKEGGYDTAAIGKMHFNSNLTHGFNLRLDFSRPLWAVRVGFRAAFDRRKQRLTWGFALACVQRTSDSRSVLNSPPRLRRVSLQYPSRTATPSRANAVS